MSYNMSYVLIVRMGYGDATRKRILYRSINDAARGDTDPEHGEATFILFIAHREDCACAVRA